MSNIVLRDGRLPNMPTLSSELHDFLTTKFNIEFVHDDNPELYGFMPTRKPSDTLCNEAVSFLPTYEVMCAPVGEEHFTLWLRKLVATKGAPSGAEFPEFARLYYFAFKETRALCFSEATCIQAMKAFKFWPTVAEIQELIHPVENELYTSLRRLRRMAIMAHERSLIVRPPLSALPGGR